ncbi:MAG: hypothetical protein RIQ54_588 [Candidatus Parcubacteria bacterium]|jgi:hypothetical protein
MKKELSLSRVFVRCIGIVALLVLTIPMLVIYTGGCDEVIRIDDPNATPLWRSPGMPIGSSVGYIDNHGGVNDQIQFYDDNADGWLKTAGMERKLVGGDATIKTRFEIVEKNNNYGYIPQQIYTSETGIYIQGDTWFVLRNSPLGKELQNRYQEVRKTYANHIGARDFPENRPPEPSEIQTAQRDEKKIRTFCLLLDEYLDNNKKCVKKYISKRKSEIYAWQAALAFYQLKCCYQTLNEGEKAAVLASMDKQKKLLYGMKIDSGPEIIGIGEYSLRQKTDRDDFEFFLANSYRETDYMSVWSIAWDGQMEKTKTAYFKELQKKGIQLQCQ